MPYFVGDFVDVDNKPGYSIAFDLGDEWQVQKGNDAINVKKGTESQRFSNHVSGLGGGRRRKSRKTKRSRKSRKSRKSKKTRKSRRKMTRRRRR
jgi:hypothetical protein